MNVDNIGCCNVSRLVIEFSTGTVDGGVTIIVRLIGYNIAEIFRY